MKDYVKPVVIENDELAEGVYAASGTDCYTVTARIHQTPQEGRGDYRIQVDGKHSAGDNHHSGKQRLTISFNMPVDYVWSNGTLVSSGNSVVIDYNYHNNAYDNIGLGDVIVAADQGLAVNGAILECNHNCGQH